MDYKKLAGILIDDMIDVRGLKYTISYLLLRAYTLDQLVELEFDRGYVEEIQEELLAEGSI
jgi:hypothetical protein